MTEGPRLNRFAFIKDSLLRRQYHAMVAYMDEVVGNVTAQLRTKGMWDNTVVARSPPRDGDPQALFLGVLVPEIFTVEIP